MQEKWEGERERAGERESGKQCRSQTGCVFVCVKMHSSSYQACRSVYFDGICQMSERQQLERDCGFQCSLR